MQTCSHTNYCLHIRIIYFLVTLLFLVMCFNFRYLDFPCDSRSQPFYFDQEKISIDKDEILHKHRKRETSNGSNKLCLKGTFYSQPNLNDENNTMGKFEILQEEMLEEFCIEKSSLQWLCSTVQHSCIESGSASEDDPEEKIPEGPDQDGPSDKAEPDVSLNNSVCIEDNSTVSEDCFLKGVGKPVYIQRGVMLSTDPIIVHKNFTIYWGTKFRLSGFGEYYRVLYEFIYDQERKGFISIHRHFLPLQFVGFGHIIYNGSLFYHAVNTNRIIKFDTYTETWEEFNLDDLSYNDSNYLYRRTETFIDFEADQNGLWAIYSSRYSEELRVIKLNPITLDILYNCTLNLNRQKVTEMFISCGTIYTIENLREGKAKITPVFNLYGLPIANMPVKFDVPLLEQYSMKYDWKRKSLYLALYKSYKYSLQFIDKNV